MAAIGVNKAAKELLIIVSILFLLLLTSVNINNYLANNKVLGIETENSEGSVFWQDFLTKNPDYIPGWIEVGALDKAVQIDPNYKIEFSN
jgi:hypothetical protein